MRRSCSSGFALIAAVLLVAGGCLPTMRQSEGSYIASERIQPVSIIRLKKVQLGWSMEQVVDALGKGGILGDPPQVCMLYPAENGGTYEIIFFEFPVTNGLVVPRDAVTGIYHSIPGKRGQFLLPIGLKGKSWEDLAK